MAAKNIKAFIKLQIKGGQANPAPPVGPALAQHGVQVPRFTKEFNDVTKDKMGKLLPVVITVYEDKSFTFIVKEPPISALIKDKLNLKAGSGVPQKDKVGHLSFDQLKEVATQKQPDMNAIDLAGAIKQVDGAARAMGVTTDIHNKSVDEVRAMLEA